MLLSSPARRLALGSNSFLGRLVSNGRPSTTGNTSFVRRGLAINNNRRDPPLPPLTNPVEQAIAAAQQRGDLNNLEGKGKPLSQQSQSSRTVIMSTSELLSKKAEFEMRRAVQNRELEHLQGQTLEYRGTSIASSSLTSSSSSSGEQGSVAGGSVMGQYILKQAQSTAEQLKK